MGDGSYTRRMSGDIATVVQALVDNVDGVVRGKHQQIRMAVACLLTEGHLLLDDVPGTGKTSLAKAIAGSIGGRPARPSTALIEAYKPERSSPITKSQTMRAR